MPLHHLNTKEWAIPHGHELVSHHARHALSRRAFMGTMAGAAGAVMGAGLLPTTVLAEGGRRSATPKPTTNTVTLGGTAFSFTFFGAGIDPSSIWDFNGLVGVADVQGTGTAQNADGSEEPLLFDTDVRFMSGAYVGVDGHVHKGTFGFIWLDLYRGQFDFNNFTTQVHDFDADIVPYPGGLFWTVPNAAVEGVDLVKGTAHMNMSDVALKDYFDIGNSLFRFELPVSAAASVSFEINWSGPVTSTGPVTTPGTTGELAMCQATMSWSGRNSLGFSYESDPTGTTSAFAQLGRVRNGVFA